MRQLVKERILRILGNHDRPMDDAAILARPANSMALTTDSYVVSPLFFPGGDIGRLAVLGTVNDLAVCGAKPLYVTLSLVLEEGLELALLDQIIRSIADAAQETNVAVVAGDTKVVPRGAADGVFINTTGLGVVEENVSLGANQLRIGDEILVSGPIGRHGMAIMAARNQLGLDPAPTSDCGSLAAPIEQLLRSGATVRTLRDATRGGVAAVLHEWAEECELTIGIDEASLPVTPDVRGACELLGIDPIHVANEGTMVIAVQSGDSDFTIESLRRSKQTANAVKIGRVFPRDVVPVTVRRVLGVETPLDEPLGAPLPRIC